MTVKHIYYSVKGALEVFKECAMAKSNQNCYIKWWRSAASIEEKMIYLDFSSQKKTSYGSSNNWILIQD